MARSKEQLMNLVAESGVVAVMRAPSAEVLMDISQALVAGGVPAIEVTMTTPKAISAIEKLADKYGDQAVVGVGTVLDSATAADAIQAGAQFVVSPVLNRDVIETTRRYGKISIPGAFTPTEIFAAWSAGADVVKVFPATKLGPEYIKDLLAPLPMLKLTPTGGVDLKNCGDWIRAGVAFVGVGSALVTKDAMAKKDWPAITASAKSFVEAIRSARAK